MIIDCVALAKQGDNALVASARPFVRLFVCTLLVELFDLQP